MEYYAYSQLVERQEKVRRLFWPGFLNIFIEALIGFLTLLILNISDVENHFLDGLSGTTALDPLAFLKNASLAVLNAFSRLSVGGQITLFVLWAVVGLLIYALIFRLIRLTLGTMTSVKIGLTYIRLHRFQGFLTWLTTLHDVFTKLITTVGGGGLAAVGVFLAFTYANLQFHIGFAGSSLDARLAILYGLVSALIGMRILVLGLCLLSASFRRWYLY